MVDFAQLVIIFTLVAVIIIQAIERYFTVKQANEERSRLLMAFLSKDATEYSLAVKTEKEPIKEFKEPDEVELAQADDSVFDKFIESQTQ